MSQLRWKYLEINPSKSLELWTRKQGHRQGMVLGYSHTATGSQIQEDLSILTSALRSCHTF